MTEPNFWQRLGQSAAGGVFPPYGLYQAYQQATAKPKRQTTSPGLQTYEEIVSSTILTPRAKKVLIQSQYPERYDEYVKQFGTPSDKVELAKTRAEVTGGGAAAGGTYGSRAWDTEARAWYEPILNATGKEVGRNWLTTPQPMAGEDALSAWQRAQIEQSQREFELSRGKSELDKSTAEWQRQQQERQMQQDEAWRQQQMQQAQQQTAQQQQQSQWNQQFQESQFQWEQQQAQMAQQQAQQQRLAQLASNPINWLQYSAESGQTPVIQPWMLPLMPQQQGWQVGAPLPGWNPQAQESVPLSGMPALTQPSAQLQARMGPTALAQYYGYQQAQTGANPEEQQFRLWSSRAPGGRFAGLTPRR